MTESTDLEDQLTTEDTKSLGWCLYCVILGIILPVCLILILPMGMVFLSVLQFEDIGYIFLFLTGPALVTGGYRLFKMKIQSGSTTVTDVTPDIKKLESESNGVELFPQPEDNLLEKWPRFLLWLFVALAFSSPLFWADDYDSFIFIIAFVGFIPLGILIYSSRSLKKLLLALKMNTVKLRLRNWPLKLGQQVNASYSHNFRGQLKFTDITVSLIGQAKKNFWAIRVKI